MVNRLTLFLFLDSVPEVFGKLLGFRYLERIDRPGIEENEQELRLIPFEKKEWKRGCERG